MYRNLYVENIKAQALEVDRMLGLPNLEDYEERSLLSRKKGLQRQVRCSPTLQRAFGPVRVVPLNKRGRTWGDS